MNKAETAPGRRWRRRLALGAALALAAVPALAGGPADVYYERAVMTAADQSCRLFDPAVGAALSAATAQARGAALRSGIPAATLAAVQARASAVAAGAGCASPDIAVAAKRVRDGFEGYARLTSMRYPGDTADWLAERPADDAKARWRLSQTVKFGWDQVTFGVAGRLGGRPLMAVAGFADGARPYAARLVMRDASITNGPYLTTRLADARGRIPLPSRLPPRSATRVFNAEGMSPGGTDLRAPGLTSAWAFRFPAAAAQAIANLDPREAVAVEFVFAGDGPDQVRTAYVEVGDFAAGQAFETVSPR